MVMPAVFRHDEPFAPLPLVMHANAPVASLTEQVSPAGQLKGFAVQLSVLEVEAVDEEHALAATAVATVAAVKKTSDPRMRMAGTLARA